MAILVGITGGIGTGKSIVCKIFNALGIKSYDSDTRAKWLMNHDGKLIQDIKEQFGNQSYDKSGVNTSFLSKTVFKDKLQLQKLNSLVHPAVEKDFNEWVKKNESDKILIKEAALLVETKSYLKLDKLILVTSPIDIRIKRILKRDPQRSVEEINEIIKNQLPEEEKKIIANYLIFNDESSLVIPQILSIFKKI